MRTISAASLYIRLRSHDAALSAQECRGPVLSHTKDTMPGSKTYPNAVAEGNGEVGICGLVGLVVQTAVAKSLTHNTWLRHNRELTTLTTMLVQSRPTYVLCSTINSTFSGSIDMASQA